MLSLEKSKAVVLSVLSALLELVCDTDMQESCLLCLLSPLFIETEYECSVCPTMSVPPYWCDWSIPL